MNIGIDGKLKDRLSEIKSQIKDLNDEKKQIEFLLMGLDTSFDGETLFKFASQVNTILGGSMVSEGLSDIVGELKNQINTYILEFQKNLPPKMREANIEYKINYNPYSITLNQFFFITIDESKYRVLIKSRYQKKIASLPIVTDIVYTEILKIIEDIMNKKEGYYIHIIGLLAEIIKSGKISGMIKIDDLYKLMETRIIQTGIMKKYSIDHFLFDISYFFTNPEKIKQHKFQLAFKSSGQGYVVPRFEQLGNIGYFDIKEIL